jgi:hypothetical protein
MSDEQRPIEIKILVDEETPFVAEKTASDVASKTRGAFRHVVGKSAAVAERAWQSDARKKVSDGLNRGSKAVAAGSSRFLQERVARSIEQQARKQAAAVRTRVQSTDWKREAKTGTASGLRWISHQLAKVADRFTPVEESSSEGPTKTPGGP